MKRSVKILLGMMVLVSAGCVAITSWARSAPRPSTLGIIDGGLAPCPPTPNCVATERARPAQLMSPLSYNEPLTDARGRLLAVIRATRRTTIVSDEAAYIATEFRTPGFGFIDDVEFRFDDVSKVIHFRSASRLGRNDLGVNRARMEALTRAFTTADPAAR